MNMMKILTGGLVAMAMAFTASNAHAIAFQNPSKTEVKQLKADLKAKIEKSAVFKSTPGAKLKLTYTPGQPTIGPNRSGVRPSITALILGKKEGMGMADNHERTYTVSVNGAKASAKAAGKWEQLDTGVFAPRFNK